MKSKADNFEAIEAGLAALKQSMFQHRAWENLQKRAGISMDRSSATLLKVVMHCGNNPCRMQDIAQKLGVEAPSVTRTVQELEAAGMVKRLPDESDRRASNITLTKKGQQQLAKMQKARKELLSEVLAEWTPQDQKQFAVLLQRFADELLKTH
ncbi:hypothetical protein BH09PAT4_BH09PAT4_00490 [soil metagenome]